MTVRIFEGAVMSQLCRIGMLGVCLSLLGCGQPELIDRTQPNYIKKSDLLEGTWYIQETIVDAPKTPSSTATIGRGGTMEKIRWEVQEDLLVAYRSYEIVPGADPRVDREKSRLGNVVLQNGQPYKGNPVFAYKIASHFDRQRQYNAATGEQSNVLVEDTQDRPWYEREYMRVNWQRNEVLNYQSTCTSGRGTGPFHCTGDQGGLYLRYLSEQDQQAQDQAMTFSRDAQGKLEYFDWTTQAIIDPPLLDYPGYGGLPLCIFNTTVDCESVDVRVRTSVLRVDEGLANDYEPLVYGDKLMKKFGFFRHESYSYSKDYYYTYSGLQQFAMRHNIWQRAHDEQGNVIPVTERALRPIVYYLTQNTPKDLEGAAAKHLAEAQSMDPSQTIEASWDKAFRRAVAVPRGLEASDVPQMFYVCESPVREGSPEACGKAGTYARIGDLRYNIIPYVDQNAGGLLGLGPSSMDPETGRVVHAAANVYGPGLDTWAGGSQQMIDVVNGELSLSDLVAGKDIEDYVAQNLSPTDPRRPASGPWSAQGLQGEPTRPLSSMANLDGRLKQLTAMWTHDNSLPLARENRREVVTRLLKANPLLEEELLNLPELKLAVDAIAPNSSFAIKLQSDSDFRRQVARNILMGDDPIERAQRQFKETADHTVGCYYEYSYSDEDYVGLAKRKLALQNTLVAKFQQSGMNADDARTAAKAEVYNSLRREAYRSVTEHEVGHTLGLRHNFIASADALNYQDGYWDLRKETIGVEVGGNRVLPVTPQSLVDAAKPNQHQLDESIYEYQYSSIMDYGARVNAQNRGTGKYDDAAILFGYAGGAEPGWVEVFNEMRTNYENPNIIVPLDDQTKVFAVRGAHVEVPLAQVEHYTPASTFYTDKYHYTTLPFHFADQSPSFEAMLNQGISRMQSRSFRKWSEMAGHYNRIEEALKQFNLSQQGLQQSDYVRARDIIKAAGGASVPVEVPYMMCTDSEVGANLMCNRNDQGADIFEMTSKWMERFNQTYVFSNFRRDRLTYSPSAVASGKFGRYLGNIPNVYQHWLFSIYFLAKYYQLTPEEMDRFYGLGDPIWQNYWTMAVVDSTNLLMQQLAVPSAGYHGKKGDGTWEYVPTGDVLNRRLSASAETALKVELAKPQNGGYADIAYLPRGPGRSMFSIFDDAAYDDNPVKLNKKVNEAGHFWDVYAALIALSTSETNFLGVDRGSDALRYSLPYYMVFNLELAPLFNNYWTEKTAYYSPDLAKQADGTAVVRLPNFIRAQDFVPGFVYPVAPTQLLDTGGRPLTTSKVAPVATWSSRFFAQYLSMAYFTTNGNLEFANFNQVFRLGSSDNLSPAPGFEVVTFDDPFGGGYVYAAMKKTGTVNLPAGAEMVERAARYRTNWDLAVSSNQPVEGKTAAQWETEVRSATRTLEMMRGLYGIFGVSN